MKQQGKGLVIVRAHRSLHFTTLKLTAIEDPRLSYKAKGLHTYLISRPPDWKIYHHDLLARATDGKDSVTSGIKEIKQCGYLSIEAVRDGKGRIVGSIWHVFEESRTEKAEPPYPENPDAGNPHPGNPQQSINHSKNNIKKTTTSDVVVDSLTEKPFFPPIRDIREELRGIVQGTPFEKVDYEKWLKHPNFLDQLDKLVQTYASDFSKAKRPQAIVKNVMRQGAEAPDGYIPYRERQSRASAAAANAVNERLQKDGDRLLRETMLSKFRDLGDQEKNRLIIEASATLGPILGASRGLSMALALELLREREESARSQGTATSTLKSLNKTPM